MVKEKLIPKLAVNSAVTMDNMSYHNVQRGSAVTSNSNEDIQWLANRRISFSTSAFKPEFMT